MNLKNEGRAFVRCLAIALLLVKMVASPGMAQEAKDGSGSWGKLQREAPEWFKDAKFGIYFHWGVYSVPAFNSEWYSRGMYIPGSKSNRHHLATYGPLEKFGYKEFIPLFRAENFDPDEWVDLFVRAGAKFAGPVAEHADGFSMWDSKVNPWNAKDMGPKRDIVKEMEKAIRKRNLKFLATFHHQWLWGWYPTFNDSLDVGDSKYASLYGPVVSPAAWQHEASAEKPHEAFARRWQAKVNEVTRKYKPDLLYFDSRLGHIQENYRKEVVSSYRKYAGGGKGGGVILYKQDDLPEGVGVRTFEKSRMNKVGEKPWLTEETISTYSWCYTEDMVIRPVKDILHSMVDIVSKNGVYLLNISPKADGTIPENQKEILLNIGGWMHQFGEAIYATRPWRTYGEGPRKEAAEKEDGDKKKFFELKYTAEDIRYTAKGNAIYAILLGQPEETREILLKSFSKNGNSEKIGRVTLLGSEEKVEWEHQPTGLSIRTPAQMPEQMAFVFKIELKPL